MRKGAWLRQAADMMSTIVRLNAGPISALPGSQGQCDRGNGGERRIIRRVKC